MKDCESTTHLDGYSYIELQVYKENLRAIAGVLNDYESFIHIWEHPAAIKEEIKRVRAKQHANDTTCFILNLDAGVLQYILDYLDPIDRFNLKCTCKSMEDYYNNTMNIYHALLNVRKLDGLHFTCKSIIGTPWNVDAALCGFHLNVKKHELTRITFRIPSQNKNLTYANNNGEKFTMPAHSRWIIALGNNMQYLHIRDEVSNKPVRIYPRMWNYDLPNSLPKRMPGSTARRIIAWHKLSYDERSAEMVELNSMMVIRNPLFTMRMMPQMNESCWRQRQALEKNSHTDYAGLF